MQINDKFEFEISRLSDDDILGEYQYMSMAGQAIPDSMQRRVDRIQVQRGQI